MKREIKFRAWSKFENKLCSVQILTDQGCFLLGLKPGKDEIIPEFRMIVKAPADGRYCPFQEIELMQFTGLLDKNGKDIFEGDIIKVSNGYYPVITKCTWEEGQYHLIDNANGYWTRQLYHQPERLKICGNIYENTELLK